MKHLQRSTRYLPILVLLCFITQGQMCSKSDQTKLLKAEDDGAVMIRKFEQARTIALTEGKIDQETATNIDRALLKANTALKHVSKAGDAFAKAPEVGTSEFRDAIKKFRAVLDETEAAIKDGTMGIKNPDSKVAFVALVSSLRSTAAIVEGIVAGMEKK